MKLRKILAICLTLALSIALFSGCGGSSQNAASAAPAPAPEASAAPAPEAAPEAASEAAPAEQEGDTGITTYMNLDDYQPKKTSYKFFFSYVVIHPWWDSVRVGMEAAQKQLAEKGIDVSFEYVAPSTPDATDQVQRLEQAAGMGYDLIGVDVTELQTVVPAINKLVDSGIPVLTFGGSDAPDSKRYVYIGNNQPKSDGAKLAEELCKALDYKGNVVALGGTIGNPVHENRIEGMKEVFEKYPDITLLDIQYDADDLSKAVEISESFIQRFPDLNAIFANNMTNPIGAAQAVEAAQKQGQVIVVGMDHDLRTLEYVDKGTVLVTGVQDCYAMGFKTIETAIKLADGERVGGEWLDSDIMNQLTQFVYKDRVKEFIDLLYS